MSLDPEDRDIDSELHEVEGSVKDGHGALKASTDGNHLPNQSYICSDIEVGVDGLDITECIPLTDVQNSKLPSIESGDNEITNDDPSEALDLSKSMVIRNLATMCGSSVLLFSAYLSIENLQSSINQQEGLGTTSVAVLYASFILSLLLMSHVTVSMFSYKWIYVVSMAAFLPYFATGFYSAWVTMIPAAFISGVGAANFWNAQQGLCNDLAFSFAKVTKMDRGAAVNLFCGIYYAFFFSAKVWGNLVSALVLREQPEPILPALAMNITKNLTLPSTYEARYICGSEFCSIDPSSESAVPRPSDSKIYTYSGVCVAMGTLGVLMAAVLLTKTPVTAFISCILGVEYVGWIMITYGVVGSIVSVVIGRLSKYSGWLPFFIIAFFLQVALLMAFLFMEPDPERPYILFILASLWAIVEAIYTPSIPAIHSTHFEDNTAAISSYRVLDSLGFVLTFGYSSALCMRYKIYIMVGMATASMISISWFHWINRDRSSLEEKVEQVRTSEDDV